MQLLISSKNGFTALLCLHSPSSPYLFREAVEVIIRRELVDVQAIQLRQDLCLGLSFYAHRYDRFIVNRRSPVHVKCETRALLAHTPRHCVWPDRQDVRGEIRSLQRTPE